MPVVEHDLTRGSDRVGERSNSRRKLGPFKVGQNEQLPCSHTVYLSERSLEIVEPPDTAVHGSPPWGRRTAGRSFSAWRRTVVALPYVPPVTGSWAMAETLLEPGQSVRWRSRRWRVL